MDSAELLRPNVGRLHRTSRAEGARDRPIRSPAHLTLPAIPAPSREPNFMRGPARQFPSRPPAGVRDPNDSRAPNRTIGRGFRRLILGVVIIGSAVAAPAAQPGITVLQPVPALLPKSGNVRLPPPPAWVQYPAAMWSVEDFTQTLKQATERPPLVSYTRVNFVRPDHQWLLAFDRWFRTLNKSLKVEFVEETWDCDNYARSFVAFADLAAMRAGEARGSICVGWATVYNSRSFGGIPAGGGHAVVIVGTSEGIFVIEPQNGEIAPLAKYPNRDDIVEINL